jgi:hypothetical protein
MLALQDDAVACESLQELERLRAIVERLPREHYRRMVLTLIEGCGRELHAVEDAEVER